MAPKSISFDVIGTCTSFSHPIDVISTRLSSSLATHSVDPKSLFFAWFYAAQRDFTYLSLCGSYTPIASVLKGTFRRACAVVDIPISDVSEGDVDAVVAAFRGMGPRDGLKACFEGLVEHGWDVYGVTNGGLETSLGYFANAGIHLDAEHLLSCDAIRVAKPDSRVYEQAHKHLTERGLGQKGEGERWFVAAHAWDLVAARKAGFKTAYLDFEEHDPVTEIYGEFDVYAKSMEELLEKVKEVA